MRKYRSGHFLLGQEAAAGHYAGTASYAACQEGWESVKGRTKCIPVTTIFRKSNKNSSELKRVLKCCLSDAMNWAYLRNTLLEHWSSFPEIVETSQRMLFLSFSRVWDLFNKLYPPNHELSLSYWPCTIYFV